jgi:guanosine-3',5'-bis(diphosphate) 3'-pyrophosphohydrolase
MVLMDDISLVLKALEFAAVRHRKQFRKGKDKSPYINHPIQVANLLANEAGEKDPVLLSATMLHDVVEDTVETKKEKKELIGQIRKLFGEEVLLVTLEVTDDKSLGKKNRKQAQIDHASSLSVKAKKLKIADKIMNVRDITVNPPVKWSLWRIRKYLDWSEKVVAGLRGVNKKLEDIFDETLRNGRAKYPGK